MLVVVMVVVVPFELRVLALHFDQHELSLSEGMLSFVGI